MRTVDNFSLIIRKCWTKTKIQIKLSPCSSSSFPLAVHHPLLEKAHYFWQFCPFSEIPQLHFCSKWGHFINNRPFIRSHLQWKSTYSLQTVLLVQEGLNPFKSCRLSTDTFTLLALESLICVDIKKETFLYLKLKVIFSGAEKFYSL